MDATFIATVLEYISKNLSRAAFPLSVLCPDRLHAKTLQQLQDEVPTLMFELAKTEGLCERQSQTPPTVSYTSEATSFKTTS